MGNLGYKSISLASYLREENGWKIYYLRSQKSPFEGFHVSFFARLSKES